MTLHANHYVSRCRSCDAVIAQCRCMAADKRVTRNELCQACRGNRVMPLVSMADTLAEVNGPARVPFLYGDA